MNSIEAGDYFGIYVGCGFCDIGKIYAIRFSIMRSIRNHIPDKGYYFIFVLFDFRGVFDGK